eukprot:10600596-Lingulodinium_polyedra.AAC.1
MANAPNASPTARNVQNVSDARENPRCPYIPDVNARACQTWPNAQHTFNNPRYAQCPRSKMP